MGANGYARGFSGSLSINSAVGSTARPTLTLQNGASSAMYYNFLGYNYYWSGNSYYGGYYSSYPVYDPASIFIGHSGGRGAVTLDNGTLQTPGSGSGEIYVGAGGAVVANTFYPGDGTLTITNGGRAVSDTTTFIGNMGGKGVVSVDGANSLLQATNASFSVGSDHYVTTNVNAPGDGTLSITHGGQGKASYMNIGYAGEKDL